MLFSLLQFIAPITKQVSVYWSEASLSLVDPLKQDLDARGLWNTGWKSLLWQIPPLTSRIAWASPWTEGLSETGYLSSLPQHPLLWVLIHPLVIPHLRYLDTLSVELLWKLISEMTLVKKYPPVKKMKGEREPGAWKSCPRNAKLHFRFLAFGLFRELGIFSRSKEEEYGTASSSLV